MRFLGWSGSEDTRLAGMKFTGRLFVGAAWLLARFIHAPLCRCRDAERDQFEREGGNPNAAHSARADVNLWLPRWIKANSN